MSGKRAHNSSKNIQHEKLTLLSRVSNGAFGIWTFSHLINSLHFYLKGREVAHICDDEGWRGDVFGVPGRTAAQNLPPHHFVAKIWAIETTPVQLLQEQRLSLELECIFL